MVARSSIARVRLPLYFAESLFIFFLSFSLATLSQKSEKTTSSKLSHTFPTRLQQNLCYIDFFKVPPKTNGAVKPKICIIFLAKSQTIISAVVQ